MHAFLLPLTDDHLETLWVVLDEGLGLHRLREEGFGDQRKANAPQHLHHVLLPVTHVILQPANGCVIYLKNTNATTKHVGSIQISGGNNFGHSALFGNLSWKSISHNLHITLPKKLVVSRDTIKLPRHVFLDHIL